MTDTSGLSPTSELDAVNIALSCVGESPVATLDENTLLESGMALRWLRIESRALQTKGWSFNTEEGIVLQPQSDGTVPLPNNAMGFQPVGNDKGSGLIFRAGKVYDRRKQTFTLNRPITGNVVLLLAFEDLPEAARYFIAVRTARKMQDKMLGDGQLHQYEETDEMEAWSEFLHREAEDADYNIVRDSSSVRAVVAGRYTYAR